VNAGQKSLAVGFLRQCGILTIFLLLTSGMSVAEKLLRYAGATTLQRIFMPEMARIFAGETAVRILIEGGNTDPGISSVLNGVIDMAGAGRLLSEAEKQQGLRELALVKLLRRLLLMPTSWSACLQREFLP
jgi:ABC-type phosphate transport system substrate-binding protein